ncbi:16S rRNA (cytosine(967)-C(5))-methyltransferase RsmB [Listeria fleischmannii]|uniref:16S rRNA (cytosine(967)-C(5))-methyltransferase n=1 Tax=Listeria fleischmannii TaxID=1069827 RepID=A0A841YGQ8_9LIST|nr:16S rRNA (cytosine(967)-C(5))-methyltransferase RsmB [Listeria fleischmannii]EIA20433.1 16S rRNA methyltransferase B [Listeria fleischmannii subsp. coloradonensis]MBC1399501.1 16S rRNA (cytosine(967)-C(5))-methyltransferase RsmB [Listeria fleischmannii]MBC1428235.1 16S rRNA (cytosine(967)-C(5))-methyltransferase RsmB [Listeria fleischmannii]STY34168.1 Ribosomal RNA small subunit methyltransferase B [Listeria fleischmannii subsp. coloradonensis]
MKKEVREIALELILKVEKQGSYSHLLINDALKKQDLNAADRGLLTELVYGTIQRKITLDFYLEPFLKKEPEDWVQNLLRLSVYQLAFLDKIPEHAILHEAGEIARKRGHEGVTKFVNGVLRNIIRSGFPAFNDISDDVLRLSIEASLPEWLAERLIDQYGYRQALELGEAFLVPPNQTVRVNTTETNPKSLVKEFADQGIASKVSETIPWALEIEKGSIANTNAFKTGKCTIQDESSMVVAYALELKDDLDVLDACAAPGGKTTLIAEKMNGTGSVMALDIHAHKTKLVEQAARRLNLLNIRTLALDARKATTEFEEKSFDRVLVDAPCSGFGVLKRKPDIKYSKKPEDITRLSEIQLAILDEVSQLVKENGILVYSTCTIDEMENAEVVQKFLNSHPEFEMLSVSVPKTLEHLKTGNDLQILPTDFGSDGFYVASFKRCP